MRAWAVPALLLGLFLSGSNASAHALDPGFLEIRSLGGDLWQVLWRVPQVDERPMALVAVLPEGCDPRRPPDLQFDGIAYGTAWTTTCLDGLDGGEIRIEGLSATRTDVLVRYELEPGVVDSQRLTAATDAFTIPAPRGVIGTLSTFTSLGVQHILQGIDHLIFVFALILLIPDRRRLIGAVTAFTVAHSLTLAAAVLGWIVVPAAPVEAVVALSIMFLASELLRPAGEDLRLSERHPWIVAFAFGLLHGLGFASALLNLGLPKAEIPLALLTFNVGVEIGQLIFIALVIIQGVVLGHLFPTVLRSLITRGMSGLRMLSYLIGSAASVWFIARVAAF